MPSGGERDYAENTLDWRNLGRSCDAHVLAARQYHGRQYQTFWLLTKRKPALVIRAAQLVLQELIGAIGVRHGAARQASPASGPKERPVAGRALIHHLAR